MSAESELRGPYNEDHQGANLLQKHGWKMSLNQLGTGPADTMRQYSHGTHGGIEHNVDGSWQHHKEGKLIAKGGRTRELAIHLSKLHGSQHSEPLDLQLSEEETKPDLTDKLTTAGPILGPAVQFREDDDDDEEVDWRVADSKHHKVLKSKGFKHDGMSHDGWTAYYKHPNGSQARIEFNHANDIHGTLIRGSGGQRPRRDDY